MASFGDFDSASERLTDSIQQRMGSVPLAQANCVGNEPSLGVGFVKTVAVQVGQVYVIERLH